MGEVVSLGEQLRARREELGISQAQAARELDVARTAYRLWEMEAAKPAPDRWRLIAHWLGISVATMLLSEDLIDADEADASAAISERLARAGVSWDEGSRSGEGTFFEQERSMIEGAKASGEISGDESSQLGDVLDRVEDATYGMRSAGWRSGSVHKELLRDETAPALARAAVAVTAAGIPKDRFEEALLLTSEIATNAVKHATEADGVLIVAASVDPSRLRVTVADGGSGRIHLKPGRPDTGWGLMIVSEFASRWGAGREGPSNVAWFELDLPTPGA